MANNNAPNTETTSQIVILQDGNPDGTTLGLNAADKVSFYGKVPYAQKASAIHASAVVTTSGTASSWGAQVSASNATATTWTKYVATTANMTATGTIAVVLGEVVETLVGLGLMKGAA
jgi:hypothetical protein